MSLQELAIPIGDDNDRQRVLALLQTLRVRMDPCAGEPRFERDPTTGGTRLRLLSNDRVQLGLAAAAQPFEVLRDLADHPDPRDYVSRTNRYAGELARLRAEKTTR